jgi:hypothetical protein
MSVLPFLLEKIGFLISNNFDHNNDNDMTVCEFATGCLDKFFCEQMLGPGGGAVEKCLKELK